MLKYKFLFFLSIVLIVYFGMHYFIYLRIIKYFHFSFKTKFLILSFFLFCASTFFLGEILAKINYQKFYLILYIGSLWLGILSIFFFVFFMEFLISYFLKVENKYLFIFSLFTAIFISLISFINAQKNPILNIINIEIKNLPKILNNFNIIQLSDLHIGNLTTEKQIEYIVNKTNELNPDLILFTGDLIDNNNINNKTIELLSKFKSKHGIIGVLGNHDFYSNKKNFFKIAEKMNMKILKNELILILDSLQVIGLEDDAGKHFFSEGPDLDKATKNYNPNLPSILLYHTPRNLEKAADKGINLILCGHTHAGQIPPMNFLVWLFYKFPWGLHKYKDSYIYISHGSSTWGPPMRFFSNSEITNIILKNKIEN